MMLDQKVTLRLMKIDNPPEPDADKDSRTLRLRGDLLDSVEEVVYFGAVFPEIYYTERSAMVAIHDFGSGAVHYHFNVVDVHVEPFNERDAQAAIRARPR